MKEFLKVGVSGVRGVIGASFTPQIAALFAQAFGCFSGHGMVLVGRDTRTSGYMIERAIIAGLQSVGCKPVLVGVVPTPTLLFLTKLLNARGGIVITASHNPAEWNALKFVDDKGLFLSPIKADELFDAYHQGDFDLVPEHSIPTVSEHPNPMDAHLKKVLEYVDTDLIEQRKFKVAVDCCNGVGAVHSKTFLERLGCEVVTCLSRPNGRFERIAEPLPENLGLLSDLVVEHSCDIGFAQDPDGDRLAIVDQNGRPVGEDMTLAFAVRQVLECHGRGPVAANLSTSKRVRYVAEQFGCDYIPTKIGEIHVTEAMLAAGSVIGGEGNGGVIIPEIHPCRDSFAGMAVVLELLASTKKTVSTLASELPPFCMIKDKVTIRGDKGTTILRRFRRKYQDYKTIFLDGVYVDLGESWFHVRMSNTEPVVRLVVESPTLELAQETAAKIKSEILEA